MYDASYFSDGFGLQTGDKILVGQEEVIVTDVLYDSHILKVNKAISWNENTPVSYNYAESNPDSGAYEYTPTINFTAIPKDGQIDLFWKSSVIFPENTNWEIAFQPKNSQLANVQTVTLPLNTYSYTLTNIPNYELYTITISASLNGETLISKTIEFFATDMFDYLPIVNK